MVQMKVRRWLLGKRMEKARAIREAKEKKDRENVLMRIIIKTFKRFKDRVLFKTHKNSVRIQQAIRGFIIRKKYKIWIPIRTIQSVVRRYLAY